MVKILTDVIADSVVFLEKRYSRVQPSYGRVNQFQLVIHSADSIIFYMCIKLHQPFVPSYDITEPLTLVAEILCVYTYTRKTLTTNPSFVRIYIHVLTIYIQYTI